MKQNNAICGIIPDKSRLKADDLFPLKLRITYKGERRYYATGYDSNETNWKLIQEKKARGDLRKTANALSQIQVNAQNVVLN